MKFFDYTTGLQHIGIPTNDIEATKAFYISLGFEVAYETLNENANEKVSFLKRGDIIIEVYENHRANKITGAIDHICFKVANIELVFQDIKLGGFELADDEIQFLPFWENGVKFFNIYGPNKEKVEFLQLL